MTQLLALGLTTRLDEAIAKHGPSKLTPVETVRYRLMQGDAEGALSLLQEVDASAALGRRYKDAELAALATLAARLDAQLAWRLVERCRRVPDCAAAVAMEAGIEGAWLRKLLEVCSAASPDALLLRANLCGAAEEQLALFNEYLSRHGLAQVAASFDGHRLAPRNLSAAASPRPAATGAPLLSVIVAGHNVQDCVELAIRSILDQSYANLELIFVDDASTDATVDRVEEFAKRDPRIKLLQLDENVGTYAAKNAAFAMASGELLAFHDADDWSHPDRYRLSIEALLADRQLMAVTSCYVRLTDDGRFVSHVTWPLKRWSPNSVVFWRKEVLARAGYLDSVRFGADSEFVARIRCVFGDRAHRKLALPLFVAQHRSHSLMNAAGSGVDRTGYSSARVAYQEQWTEWHLRSASQGLAPSLRAGERIAERMQGVAPPGTPQAVTVLPMSSGIARIPFLGEMLSARILKSARPGRPDTVAGWGRKKSGVAAAAEAARLGCAPVYLEDGFLRSFGTGDAFPPVSVVVDEVGIYYDATRPSALENLLNSGADLLHGAAPDAQRARSLIVRHRLSKYNHAPEWAPPAAALGGGPKVLVIDQTAGDLSISLGGADAQTFRAMLAAARAENPEATIFVKTHPEVSSGRKGGYLTDVRDDERTVVLRQAINPLSLIERMDRVYVVTSTMGFEALLAGKPVTCFGQPWYAGWGATDDRQACPRRVRRRNVDELFAAAYLRYTRYLDPVTRQPGTIFDAIAWLVAQKRMAERMQGEDAPARLICVGYRRWKAANLQPMLGLRAGQAVFARNVAAARALAPRPGDWLVFWGALPPAGLLELAASCRARAVRMEDGFVRSVGLGSDLIRPLSLVLDEHGIYFDPGQPSALERLLEAARFDTGELERAQAVRRFIVEHGVTKYNVEPRRAAAWGHGGRRVLLVPGQVEDDASIRLGCGEVRTNLGLLEAARRARPDAYIVYKPHPDVTSGNRAGRLALDQARRFADHIELELSVVSCIEACDEVHTMTSLTGFDALLRGKKVVTYGQPFYAGWGLTEDRMQGGTALARRTRRLHLDELVAGTLLRYPIYWDWELRGYTSCEAVLHRIVETRAALEADGGLEKLRVGFARRQLRKLQVLLRAWTGMRGWG